MTAVQTNPVLAVNVVIICYMWDAIQTFYCAICDSRVHSIPLLLYLVSHFYFMTVGKSIPVLAINIVDISNFGFVALHEIYSHENII